VLGEIASAAAELVVIDLTTASFPRRCVRFESVPKILAGNRACSCGGVQVGRLTVTRWLCATAIPGVYGGGRSRRSAKDGSPLDIWFSSASTG
jgi:hypothetical protein